MAKVIERIVESKDIKDVNSFWPVYIIGLASGVFFWLIAYLLNQFVISWLFCSYMTDASACNNALMISGNISSALIAVVGVFVMVKKRMTQPLIVSVATTASLWGLAQWVDGVQILESILWCGLAYLLAYLLFSWIVRHERIWLVVLIILVIVMAIRVVANL